MRKLEEDMNEEEISSASIERNYMTDVIKEIISNGTVEYKTCKSKKSSSFSREEEVHIAVNNIFKFSGLFYSVRN